MDLVFHPHATEMYDEKFCTYVDIDGLSDTLCGASRPVHFRGVCTVITKLLNIVSPDKIFFGQKDAQQLAIVRRMVKDLNFHVEVIGCPIVREADGLAKSSRNTYLNEEERKAALILSRTIRLGQDMVSKREKNNKILLNTGGRSIAVPGSGSLHPPRRRSSAPPGPSPRRAAAAPCCPRSDRPRPRRGTD